MEKTDTSSNIPKLKCIGEFAAISVVCDPDDSCTGAADAACPTHEIQFCASAGCSPGFWKTHTELWDGGGDDATSIDKVQDEWLADVSNELELVKTLSAI